MMNQHMFTYANTYYETISLFIKIELNLVRKQSQAKGHRLSELK